MTLTDFLLARYAEDKDAARSALTDRWWTQREIAEALEAVFDSYGNHAQDASHIARHDPARVLADVEAKRQIVELHRPTSEPPGGFTYPEAAALCGTCGPGDSWEAAQEPYGALPCYTLRLLAAPFADHPDFDPTWRP